MEIISLDREKEFVHIRDGAQKYYGGDQAWFGFTVGAAGGCGVVAAANLLAYTAEKAPEWEREEFTRHMNRVYDCIHPFKIPFVSPAARPFLGFGWTIGLWPAGRLSRGLKRYASKRGLLVTIRRGGGRGSLDRAARFLAEALERDCPVAMLIGWNRRLDNTVVYCMDGTSWVQKNMSFHWVTATAVCFDGPDGKAVQVKVSTWGGYAWLDLGEYLKGSWPQGMVYMEYDGQSRQRDSFLR